MAEIEAAVQKHDYVEFRDLTKLLMKVYKFLDEIEIKTNSQFNLKVFSRGKKKQ